MISGLELEIRRKRLKYSQREFANMLAITQEHYNRLENGKLPITRKVERRYEDLFGKERLTAVSIGKDVICPKCNSDKVPVYESSHLPIRYHKCSDCGHTFKSIEENYQEEKT